MIEHKDLYDILITLEIPVAYDHFESNKEVSIPFLVYREVTPNTFRADDLTYHQFFNYELELVTEKKEVAIERQIEGLLTENKIPYDKLDEVWDNEERIYHNFYEI
ncbi:MAG: hypothetical protein IKD74_03580 [Clostridia bacterium]|nr:hypothetical protein [Clostridia bacterium]